MDNGNNGELKTPLWGWYSAKMGMGHNSYVYSDKDNNKVFVTTVSRENINPYPATVTDVIAMGPIYSFIKKEQTSQLFRVNDTDDRK